jgi:uncharacterized protein YpuA (DUF1002 family)
METNWTKSEFKAYLLSYAANANYFESEEEKEIIQKMVSHDDYIKVHRELSKDNDYQSIQKILHTLDRFNYTKDELHHLVDDINSVFNADGEHDVLEDNMLLTLKKFLK